MPPKLGQILIRRGKITREQLQEALRTQEFFGGYLGSHLINLGHLDEDTLGSVLSEIHDVPHATFDVLRSVKMKTASALPSSLALRYKALPLKVEGNRLFVAMTNPRDTAALNAIGAETGLNVVPLVAPEFRIVQTIERLYRVRPKGKRGIVIQPAAPDPPPPSRARSSAKRSRSRKTPAMAAPVAPTPSRGEPDLSADPTLYTAHPPSPQPSEATPDEYPRSLREWRDDDLPGVEELDLDTVADSSQAPDIGLPPESMEELAGRLRKADSREQICRAVTGYMATRFKRAVVLAILPDRVRVLDAAGTLRSPDALRQLSLPSDPPNLFEALRGGRTFHLGPTPPLPGSRVFFWALGGDPPKSVFIIPILVRDRTVALLYADNESEDVGPVDLEQWRRLSLLTGIAFEIQLLKNKLR
jgi:hypothetical protein